MLELMAAGGAVLTPFSKVEQIPGPAFRLYCNSVVAYGDGIYVIGGTGGIDNPNREVQSYATMFFNVKTQQWSRKTNVPDDILRAPVCVHNGLIWVLGTTKMMTYNPTTDQWVVRQNTGFSCRSARMFGYGDYLYFFGGEFNGATVSDELRRYHIPSATFELVAKPSNFPFGRAYYGAVQVGKFVYMHGGYRPSAQPPSGQFSQFWRYDMELNTWEQLASSPLAMHTHQIRYLRGKIVTGGAWSNAGDSGQLFEYDIKRNQWMKGLSMPYSGWWLSFETVGDEGFLMGGSSNASFSGATAQVWRLS